MALARAEGAPDVLLLAPDGPPVPGGRAVVEVAVADGDAPLAGAQVTVVPSRGRVLASEGEVAPGRYRFRYQAGPTGEPDRFEIRVGEEPPVGRSFALGSPPVPALGAPADGDAPVGAPRVELRFPSADPPDPADLVVRASEGRVLEVRRADDAVIVVVEPGPERYARALGVGVLDLRRPGERPVLGLVRLRARPQFSITAERGSTATLRVGGRSYGPFVADAAGQVLVAFDAWPGDTSYELVVADDLGNTQRSTGPLATSPRPVLLGLEGPLPGENGADVFLAAWTPAGQRWSGAPPTCRTGAGVREDAALAEPGLYSVRVQPPVASGALFDPRVGCVLQEATASLRVPLGGDRPARVELAVYPDAVSADFPIAQVQAALLDRSGNRLPPDALTLRADRGELTAEPLDGALRAEYRGAGAVEAGGDRLEAAWSAPPGKGAPWSLELWAAADRAGLVVSARALDRWDRPLGGVPVRLAAGSVVMERTTDARGWAQAWLAWNAPVATVRAEAGAAVAETAAFRGAPARLPDPTAPDLFAAVDLPIRAGRVRTVWIDAAPRPLPTGSGQTADVVVRMHDAAGNLVSDEPVRIEATEGSVGPPEARADGAIVARYTPPAGLVARTVRLTASTSAGAASTDLELVPRPVRGSLAVGLGWLSDLGQVSTPTIQAAWTTRVPGLPEAVQARLAVGGWSSDAVVRDPLADADIAVRTSMVPIEVGVAGVQRAGRQSLEAGIGAVVAPYRLAVDYGDERGLEGFALSSPGLALHVGAGWRLGGSEIFAEGRYYLFTASSPHVSFDGALGGVSLAAGYRVLY